MQNELAILILTFPFFLSVILVSCLKSHTSSSSSAEHSEDSSEVYVKTVIPPVNNVKRKKEKEKKKPEKTKKDEKKTAKTVKFFVFNTKEDETLKSLKSPSLVLENTQSVTNSDEEEIEPLSSYHFSDDERVDGLVLLPSPPPNYTQKLLTEIRKSRKSRKSPDYLGPEEEDTLFSVPSLVREPKTIKSNTSMLPLEIQDSRILHVQRNERLGNKKSHAMYGYQPHVYDNIESSKDSDSEVTMRNY